MNVPDSRYQTHKDRIDQMSEGMIVLGICRCGGRIGLARLPKQGASFHMPARFPGEPLIITAIIPARETSAANAASPGCKQITSRLVDDVCVRNGVV